jgi:hypothetical protein
MGMEGRWLARKFDVPFYFTVTVINTGIWSCFVHEEVYKGLVKMLEEKDTVLITKANKMHYFSTLFW